MEDTLIVWIASYPRSGNTFARIVLNRIYGVPTYTVVEAADDLSYDVGAGDLTGNRLVGEQWPEWCDREKRRELVGRLDDDEEIYFIKTHGATHYWEHRRFRAIIIVRNAQDVFISFANYLMDVLLTWPRFWKQMRQTFSRGRTRWSFKRLFAMARATFIAQGAKWIGMRDRLIRRYLREMNRDEAWSRFHREWIERPEGRYHIIHFEDLIRDPIGTIDMALRELEIPLDRGAGTVPSFEELKKIHPKFFRKGRQGTWKKEFPRTLQNAFWEQHGPMMEQLGYPRESGS